MNKRLGVVFLLLGVAGLGLALYQKISAMEISPRVAFSVLLLLMGVFLLLKKPSDKP